MCGIAGPHAARLLTAVERKRVGAKVLEPEPVLEALLELCGLCEELLRAGGVTEPAGTMGGCDPSRIDIALHLDERDRAIGEFAIGVEDGVVGIFPALILQPFRGRAGIFEKAVAIGVARAVDPMQRALDIRPDLTEEVLVAGALNIETGQKNEERRGIDAAVIKAERNLAERR